MVVFDALPRVEDADDVSEHDLGSKKAEHLFLRLAVQGGKSGPFSIHAVRHECSLDKGRAQRPYHLYEGRAVHHQNSHAVGDIEVHYLQLNRARM